MLVAKNVLLISFAKETLQNDSCYLKGYFQCINCIYDFMILRLLLVWSLLRCVKLDLCTFCSTFSRYFATVTQWLFSLLCSIHNNNDNNNTKTFTRGWESRCQNTAVYLPWRFLSFWWSVLTQKWDRWIFSFYKDIYCCKYLISGI